MKRHIKSLEAGSVGRLEVYRMLQLFLNSIHQSFSQKHNPEGLVWSRHKTRLKKKIAVFSQTSPTDAAHRDA